VAEGAVIAFGDVHAGEVTRKSTGIGEVDRVLGGGIVPGSLILVGGEPGIGKSTLILQVACNVAGLGQEVLYVSGEESAGQVKMRLDRLGLPSAGVSYLGEEQVEVICQTAVARKPALVVVDSIQTIRTRDASSEAGSVNQIKASTVKLLECAKEQAIPIVMIGHVTKEGMLGGPKTLEHLVDTVAYVEGDPHHGFRLLRTVKNRFGPVSEVGVFEMTSHGMEEVKDPSRVFVEARMTDVPGNALGVVLEGSRAFLVEVQALVSRTSFGYPVRKSAGFDVNRLQLLLAVLGQRLKMNVGMMDVHLNITGGLRVTDPAVDLSICAALISGLKGKTIPPDTAFIGEVGLGGEVRRVAGVEQRVRAAQRLGLKQIVVPAGTSTERVATDVLPITHLRDLLQDVILGHAELS
jgi:DNA repair protein RadA/Sms